MRRILSVIATLSLSVTACAERGPSAARDAATREPDNAESRSLYLVDNAQLLGAFTLEETDEVVVVDPHVSMDGPDGLLMADQGEHQVRRYTTAGKIEWHFGTRGQGPTDLLEPLGVVRLSDSTLYVASYMSRDSRWSADGDSVLQVFTGPEFLPPRQPRSAVALGDLVALGNRSRITWDEDLSEPIIALVDPRSGDLVRKFFSPHTEDFCPTAVDANGYPAMATRGDTIAAAYSISDTVHLFDVEGNILERIPIPFTRYHPAALTPEEYREQFFGLTLDETTINTLHWLEDGSFLVQFRDRVRGPGDVTFHLLRMSRSGTLLFEDAIVRLRAVDPQRLVVYLQHPAFLEPNRWQAWQLEPVR